LEKKSHYKFFKKNNRVHFEKPKIDWSYAC